MALRTDCIQAAWRTHRAELRGYLLHRLGDASLADDLVQDVFVKAMRQGEAFCALDQPRAWLFQVARNALVDRARGAPQPEPLPDDLHDRALDDADSMEPVDLLAGCVVHVLRELSREDAAVLQACDLDGQTQRAFALAHGLSLAAAKSRLLRARQRLRERLVTNCRVRFDEHGKVCCHVPRHDHMRDPLADAA